MADAVSLSSSPQEKGGQQAGPRRGSACKAAVVGQDAPPARPAASSGSPVISNGAAAAAASGADIGQVLDAINACKLVARGAGGPTAITDAGAQSLKWVQPSGPRQAGQGCEDQEQGVVVAERTHTGGATVRITLLAGGFIIGPAGASVRDICRLTHADIKSWTAEPDALCARPTRVFRVEGPRRAVAHALGIVCDAVTRYKDLCEGKYAGQSVGRTQSVEGVDFSYQPPPRTAVPYAASLKGQSKRQGGVQVSTRGRSSGGASKEGSGRGSGGAWSSPPSRRSSLDQPRRTSCDGNESEGGARKPRAPLTLSKAYSAPAPAPQMAKTDVLAAVFGSESSASEESEDGSDDSTSHNVDVAALLQQLSMQRQHEAAAQAQAQAQAQAHAHAQAQAQALAAHQLAAAAISASSSSGFAIVGPGGIMVPLAFGDGVPTSTSMQPDAHKGSASAFNNQDAGSPSPFATYGAGNNNADMQGIALHDWLQGESAFAAGGPSRLGSGAFGSPSLHPSGPEDLGSPFTPALSMRMSGRAASLPPLPVGMTRATSHAPDHLSAAMSLERSCSYPQPELDGWSLLPGSWAPNVAPQAGGFYAPQGSGPGSQAAEGQSLFGAAPSLWGPSAPMFA